MKTCTCGKSVSSKKFCARAIEFGETYNFDGLLPHLIRDHNLMPPWFLVLAVMGNEFSIKRFEHGRGLNLTEENESFTPGTKRFSQMREEFLNKLENMILNASLE